MDDGIRFLPQEIIRNILKRLPVKSLMRFQCVCREWRILFKTKSFIADHLDHSNHQNPCLVLQSFGEDDSNLYCLDSEMQVWEFQNPPLFDYLAIGKILDSSNGLLCIGINKPDEFPHVLLLWNPAIREVRLVPKPNFYEDYCCYFIVFGFSPINNDYKIVITYFYGISSDLSAVEVYSLNSGSWKEVKFGINGTVSIKSASVTVNGVMFWLASKRVEEDSDDDGEKMVVSFDLAVEVFTMIPIPELQTIKLGVYEEKLAMFSWSENSEYYAFDMWVMEEGVGASGERWGWTKKYASSPSPCFLIPKTVWRNEIVCCPHEEEEEEEEDKEEDESTVVLLNPTSKTIKKFAIGRCDSRPFILNYTESLVPVGGIKSSTNFL